MKLKKEIAKLKKGRKTSKSKKILGKPKVKLPRASATEVIKQYARESAPLVKEPSNLNRKEINVSMFKRELIKEKSWLYK